MERNEEVQGKMILDAQNHQGIILAQFLRSMETMWQLDEALQWLSEVMAQRLKVEVMQIWTTQSSQLGDVTQTLRTLSLLDTTMPQHIVINTYTKRAVDQLLSKRQGMTLQVVDSLFPAQQIALLKRYGLYYCASSMVVSPTPLPPAQSQILTASKNRPDMLVILVFLKKPCRPAFLHMMGRILEQALAIAEPRGLFRSPYTDSTAGSFRSIGQSEILLYELIPHRVRSTASMRSSSPFNDTTSISDKQALAFLSMADGTKTIAEIATLKGLSAKGIATSLRILLQEKRIQLSTREGQLIENETILQHL